MEHFVEAALRPRGEIGAFPGSLALGGAQEPLGVAKFDPFADIVPA